MKKKKKEKRGGAGRGQGRKPGEPTVVKRIPVAIVPAVDKLIAEHALFTSR